MGGSRHFANKQECRWSGDLREFVCVCERSPMIVSAANEQKMVAEMGVSDMLTKSCEV